MYPKPLEGRFDQLCDEYDFEPVMFCGFIDGINSSLKTPYEMKKIRINSRLKFELDYEALYYNKLEAKADWLYNLPEWDALPVSYTHLAGGSGQLWRAGSGHGLWHRDVPQGRCVCH